MFGKRSAALIAQHKIGEISNMQFDRQNSEVAGQQTEGATVSELASNNARKRKRPAKTRKNNTRKHKPHKGKSENCDGAQRVQPSKELSIPPEVGQESSALFDTRRPNFQSFILEHSIEHGTFSEAVDEGSVNSDTASPSDVLYISNPATPFCEDGTLISNSQDPLVSPDQFLKDSESQGASDVSTSTISNSDREMKVDLPISEPETRMEESFDPFSASAIHLQSELHGAFTTRIILQPSPRRAAPLVWTGPTTFIFKPNAMPSCPSAILETLDSSFSETGTSIQYANGWWSPVPSPMACRPLSRFLWLEQDK